MRLQFFYFFLNTSEWLLPNITVIFPLFRIFSEYHSNLSIIPDIFRYYNKALFNNRYSRWYMSNHMLNKGEKIEQKKLINTNVITRHNAIAMSRDLQSWRSSFSPFKHIYYFRHANIEHIKNGRTYVSELVNLVSPWSAPMVGKEGDTLTICHSRLRENTFASTRTA